MNNSPQPAPRGFAFLFLSGAGIISLLSTTLAMAHDSKHPELRQWFEGLKSDKGPCCSYVDGSSVADPDWVSYHGHYKVRVPTWDDLGRDEMVWVEVPDEAVIKEPNLTGRTWVWPVRMGKNIIIRCFMPGSMT